MYTQDNKLIYIVKNAVRAEAAEAAKAVTAPGAELTGGLKTAKAIIEKNQGCLLYTSPADDDCRQRRRRCPVCPGRQYFYGRSGDSVAAG